MRLFHKLIYLPLNDLLKGECTSYYFHFIKKAEKWSNTKIEQYQNCRLTKLIKYASNNVPFYQDLFKKYEIQGIKSSTDLRLIPIVDKAVMKQEGIARFTSHCFPEKNRMCNRSSGSTGEPFSYFISKKAYSVNTAAKLRTWYKAGYRLGDKYMKIANGERKGAWKRLQDAINNCIYVSFDCINEKKIINILQMIETRRPQYIRSYPAPLYILAQYRNSHDGYYFCPKRIMTTGSTLSTEYREEIERAFGCDIIDSYSCEGTPNTYETMDHNGYNVTDIYGIIEVLDEEDQIVHNGIGRVVATDLWNYAYPFIRYDTHDLVEVKNDRIIRIMGRECETYITTGNTRYTVHNFSRFFLHDINNVEAYQIVQKNTGDLIFRLVVSNSYTEEDSKHIVEYWADRLDGKVSIELVNEIPLQHNNKRLTIIYE